MRFMYPTTTSGEQTGLNHMIASSVTTDARNAVYRSTALATSRHILTLDYFHLS